MIRTGLEPDPHGAILRAARWAEQKHKPHGGLPTWTALYQVAGDVAGGMLDVSDMPAIGPAGKDTWKSVSHYLRERHGIDIIERAYEHVPLPSPDQIATVRAAIAAWGDGITRLFVDDGGEPDGSWILYLPRGAKP